VVVMVSGDGIRRDTAIFIAKLSALSSCVLSRLRIPSQERGIYGANSGEPHCEGTDLGAASC